MIRILSTILLLSIVSLGYSDETFFIRFVNAVFNREITVTTNVGSLPSYSLPYTGDTDYIPVSTTNGQISVSFSSNGSSLTATPLSVRYTFQYTLLVIFVDHNNVINLIPFNETEPESMIDNESLDGSVPARSWIRIIGLNQVQPNLLISLNDTETNVNLFNHVAFLQSTPYVEIPSDTTGLLAYVSSDSSMNFPINAVFANSTAYTIFYFSNDTVLSIDRYVPFNYTAPSTTNSIMMTSGDIAASTSGDNGADGSSGATAPSGSTSSTSSSSSTSSTTEAPVGASNGEGDTSSSPKMIIGIASIMLALLVL